MTKLFTKFLVLFLFYGIIHVLCKSKDDILEEPVVNELKKRYSCPQESAKPNPCNPISSDDNKNDNPPNVHVNCQKGGPEGPLYSVESDTKPNIQCKRCNLNVAPDNKSVIVECFECYDLDQDPKNRTSSDIAYVVHYIEIPSYTSPDDYYYYLNMMRNETAA